MTSVGTDTTSDGMRGLTVPRYRRRGVLDGAVFIWRDAPLSALLAE
jgi:hypothetical protein